MVSAIRTPGLITNFNMLSAVTRTLRRLDLRSLGFKEPTHAGGRFVAMF